jgi:PAS domain S-box-containing protein
MNENTVGTTDEENQYRHLVEHIQDAVVEFELRDGEPVVRDVNEAFVGVFGYEFDDIIGESLNEWIVPEWLLDEARNLDEQTAAGEINYRRVKRETATGLREFLYRSIPYEVGSATGGFAVYTDLSEITRKERRLQVMNRVLRHNLRNNTNLITAHTTRLLDALDEQTAEATEAAATIERAAHDLEQLTQETADVRRVLTASEDAVASIDCVPLVQRTAQTHRRRSPGVSIETELPDAMTVRANQNLELAIDQLVDNAIKHNPAETPRLRVRVTDADADGWATICVDDDGPTIPDRERAVITGDADITATQHGSGLGLWLVKWTAELFGGELSFAESDLGGNSVCVRLPRGESADARHSVADG